MTPNEEMHDAARLLVALPRENVSPETTQGREGYIHPSRIEGGVDRTVIRLLLRDYELAGLAESGARLAGLCEGMQAAEPRAKLSRRGLRWALEGIVVST